MLVAILALQLVFASNTNQCLQLTVSVAQCLQNAGQNCCSQFQNFANSQCICNKITKEMMNEISPQLITNMPSQCGFTLPSCTGFDTNLYNDNTCTMGDAELDYQRYVAAKTFAGTLFGMSDNDQCFDYLKFRDQIANIVGPNSRADAGQGLGVYTGLDHIAEYFSLLSPSVNKGFIYVSLNEKGPKTVLVSPGGNNITFGLYVINRYANNAYIKNPTDYLEIIFTFNGCNLKAQRIYIPPVSTIYPNRVTGVASLTEMFYKTVNVDKYQPNNYKLPLLGIVGICKQHTKFCTGTNAQFDSFEECMEYYKSLPRHSSVCGTEAIASGNSVLCRAKHQFMVQISARSHCPHLGKNSASCDDTKCDNKGPSTAVNIVNWEPELVSQLGDYANIFYMQEAENKWKYGDYCKYLNEFGSWYNVRTFSKIVDLTMFDNLKIWAIDAQSRLYKCNEGFSCNSDTETDWTSVESIAGVTMTEDSKIVCANFKSGKFGKSRESDKSRKFGKSGKSEYKKFGRSAKSEYSSSTKCVVGSNNKNMDNWIQLPFMPHITVNRDGSLWALDGEGALFYVRSYLSPAWVKIPTGLRKFISISSVLTNFGQAVICGVDENSMGLCSDYDGDSPKLDFFPTGRGFSEIIIAGDGTLYSRTTDSTVMYCNDYFNCRWNLIDGLNISKLVAVPGKVCGLDKNSQISCSLAKKVISNKNN